MSRKIQSQSDEHGRDDIGSALNCGNSDADGSNAHGIFDERFQLFTDAFGSTCEQENVATAAAIVIDPKMPQQPIIFTRGNEYELAKLLTVVLRSLQQQIIMKITP